MKILLRFNGGRSARSSSTASCVCGQPSRPAKAGNEDRRSGTTVYGGTQGVRHALKTRTARALLAAASCAFPLFARSEPGAHALWDTRGKAPGVPVYKLLRGLDPRGVRTYHADGVSRPDAFQKLRETAIQPGASAATLHANSAMPNFVVQEVCSQIQPGATDKIWHEWLGFPAMRMVDGRFPLAQKPSLGFELTEEALAKYSRGGTPPMARVFHEDVSVAEW